MKGYRFTGPAEEDLAEAIDYYDRQRVGLGDEFVRELWKAIQRVRDWPNAWTKLSEHTRRCRLNRFPYAVLYQVRDDQVLIIAIMHLHRQPNSWRNRERGL
jgi:plasmid stabilization system protein ParE